MKKYLFPLLAAAAGASMLALPARAGAQVAVNFSGAAEAPIMQGTQDDPTAQFHPQGEGEYGHSFASADPAGASALASVLWPGAAAGHAGSLASLLGVPGDLSALNDPVQASAATGTSQTSQNVSTPTGTTMSASVQPAEPGGQQATASEALAGGTLGAVGSVGHSTSSSSVTFDPNSAKVSVTAASHVTDINLAAGLVHIGSVTSSAAATSTGGAVPQTNGQTLFQNMTIGGQPAYVDSTGVHVGSPGSSPTSVEQQLVDSALNAAGMQVYFTSPHKVTIGGTAYYYAASVLFYWQPPGDTNHDTISAAFGGAAASLDASGTAGSALGDLSGSSGLTPAAPSAVGGGSAPVAGTGGQTALSLPLHPTTSLPPLAAPATSGGLAPAPVDSSPASGPAAAGHGGSNPASVGSPAAAVALPAGLGVGWWLLVGALALLGAAGTTRLPALLERQAAGRCPLETSGRRGPQGGRG